MVNTTEENPSIALINALGQRESHQGKKIETKWKGMVIVEMETSKVKFHRKIFLE